MPELQLATDPEDAVINGKQNSEMYTISPTIILRSEFKTKALTKLNIFLQEYIKNNPERSLHVYFAILRIAICGTNEAGIAPLKLMEKILKQFPILTNAYDSNGETLLMLAAYHEKLLVMDLLKRFGVNPKLPSIASHGIRHISCSGETAAHMCARLASVSSETMARLIEDYNAEELDALYAFITKPMSSAPLMEAVVTELEFLTFFDVVDDAEKNLAYMRRQQNALLYFYSARRTNSVTSPAAAFVGADGDRAIGRRIRDLLYTPYANRRASLVATLYFRQSQHYKAYVKGRFMPTPSA